MSGPHDDLKLTWEGKTYVIPLDMRAVRAVERVVVRPECQADLERNGFLVPSDISEVVAGLLNLAGAGVTHEQVDQGMFGRKADAAAVRAAMAIITGVLQARVAPAHLEVQDKNARPPKAAPSRSSKRRTARP